MRRFFLVVSSLVAVYYGDILLSCNWETVTGLLKLDVLDCIFWGRRCYAMNKENFRKG
nr:MAG TPA: hypothetical protein [Caudoviricetes sp.]